MAIQIKRSLGKICTVSRRLKRRFAIEIFVTILDVIPGNKKEIRLAYRNNVTRKIVRVAFSVVAKRYVRIKKIILLYSICDQLFLIFNLIILA